MSDSTGSVRRTGGSIMASVIVLFVGMTGVCVVAMLVTPDNASLSLAIVGGSLFVFALLVLGLIPRVPMPSGSLAWFKRRRGCDDYLGYNPRLDKPVIDRFGTNAPPTVEEVRDIKEQASNWVPSRTASSRARPSRRG